ncbi:hypothetical protein RB595_006611 [Gaeumannomyces hyphopodioides]
MKTTTLSAATAAIFLGAQQFVGATHAHRMAHQHYERRHHGHGHAARTDAISAPVSVPELGIITASANEASLEKRSGDCSLPDDSDLVAVTSNMMNKGFAMSPDQACKSGMYCPIACKPGKVMAQWKPNTSYKVSESMDGGLYCDNGKPVKPFPGKPYCVDGTGTVTAVNKCGKVVSFCQTVLPGNEAMLIPTEVSGSSVLAVPDTSYWASTAAHFYINPPGTTASQGCIWGSDANPVGNWAPYVAGANTVADGSSYVQISWNPIYQDSKWSSTKPSFGVKIECNGGGCNGLPCEIDPSKSGLKGVTSNNKATGAGGADFCVVTVPKGSTANIVVFNTDGSTGEAEKTTTSSAPAPKPTTTSTSTTPPTTTSSSSSSTSPATTSSSSSSEESTSSSSSQSVPTVRPGIFQENGTTTSTTMMRPTTTPGSISTASTLESAPKPTESKNDGASRDKGGAAVVGLIVAIVAAAWMY